MAIIKVEELEKYLDSLKDWLSENDSPAKECLVIKFKNRTMFEKKIVIDEEMANKTLYLQSRNGNVSLEFDSYGYITSFELC